MAFLPNGDRTEAIIREKSRFPELRNQATNEIERRACSRYVVKLPNRNDAEANVDDDQLVRDRKVFTKAMLRSFIKNTVSREAWTGAPWVVKEQYAKKYKIDSTVPPHLMRGLTAADRKAALVRRKEAEAALLGHLRTSTASVPPAETTSTLDIRPIPSPPKSHKSKSQQAAMRTGKSQDISGPGTPSEGFDREASITAIPMSKIMMKQEIKPTPAPKPPPPVIIRYPIEDLQIPMKAGASPRPTLHLLTHSPASNSTSTVSNGLGENTAHFLLETWVFLNIYCEPFLLDSFTFDDYHDAIQFSSEDIDSRQPGDADCTLFVEVHCSLLKSLVGEGDNGRVEISLPEIPDSDDDDENSNSRQSEAPEDIVEVKARDRSSTRIDDDNDVEMEGDEKIQTGHRASELFLDGYNWISRLRRRDFRNGGWQVIIVGLLDQLSVLSKYSSTAEKALSHLVPPDVEPTAETVRERYISLGVDLKVLILHILVGLSYDAPMVRKYMEECSEAMTEYRKKKIEHQRARKVL